MRNFAFKLAGNLLISYYTDNSPSNDEADAALEVFRNMNFERLRSLSFTRGGTHTAAQRKKLHDVLAGRELKTAVVTDAHFVRGVVTATSWFNKSVKAFPFSAWEDAFAYLDIPPGQHDRIWDIIKALEAEVEKSHENAPSRRASLTRGPGRASGNRS
jgi:hypothetical protein